MKEHATYWHWGDWIKDTATLRPATRGIWLDMIGEMVRLQTDRINTQFERLPYVLRASMEEIMIAAIDLSESGAAEVLIDNQNITQWRANVAQCCETELSWMANRMAKARLTIICRRRAKELEISKMRSENGRLGAMSLWQNKGKPNGKGYGKHMEYGNGDGDGSSSGGGKGEDFSETKWPPTLDDFKSAAATIGMTQKMIEDCFHYYAASDFMRGQTRLTNFSALLAKWKSNESNFTTKSKGKPLHDPTKPPPGRSHDEVLS